MNSRRCALCHQVMPVETPKNFYFTFGVGSFLKNKYVLIIADTEDQARNVMFSLFGNKWSMVYSDNYQSSSITSGETTLLFSYNLNTDKIETTQGTLV